jgi:hypothetical protein
MAEPYSAEERIQAMADMLSLVAIIGRIDKAAIQRVLISLGSTLFDVQTAPAVDRELARKLLVEIAAMSGEEAALHIAGDLAWVARSWRPVLDEFMPFDPYRPMPFAEILYALMIHSGYTLQEHETFERFGGPDVVLPLPQLSAALSTYPIPKPGLRWEMVGFSDPPDQALIASNSEAIFLFKAATSGVDLRFSELERGNQNEAKSEHDVRVDTALFAAFVAGLIGDMLYWAARLRSHALPGHEMWQRIQALLVIAENVKTPNDGKAAPPRKESPSEQASA